jgi:hypothetical protein
MIDMEHPDLDGINLSFLAFPAGGSVILMDGD